MYHNDIYTQGHYQEVEKPFPRLPFHYRPLEMVDTHTKWEMLGVAATTKQSGEQGLREDEPKNYREILPQRMVYSVYTLTDILKFE